MTSAIVIKALKRERCCGWWVTNPFENRTRNIYFLDLDSQTPRPGMVELPRTENPKLPIEASGGCHEHELGTDGTFSLA